MPRYFLGVAAGVALLVLAPGGRAEAQLNGLGGDPFSLYYGYFLPQQAALAAQPSPLDSINQRTLRLQQSAQTDRSSLYDPISPYGNDDDVDSMSPYSSRRRNNQGQIQAHRFDFGSANPVARGYGPSMYFNRTARYYRDLKVGRGPNRNVLSARNSRNVGGTGAAFAGGGGPGGSSMGGGGGMGMGGGMPSMPSAPGPR